MRFTTDEIQTVIETMQARIAIIASNGKYNPRYRTDAERERAKLDRIEALSPDDDVSDSEILAAMSFHLYGEDAALDPLAYLRRKRG